MTKVEARRAAELKDALRGVELHPGDERVIAWLARADSMTVEALADLIERARVAALDAETAEAA
jgi:Ser/Thr protein kinase RdoA (MazF antagonist)